MAVAAERLACYDELAGRATEHPARSVDAASAAPPAAIAPAPAPSSAPPAMNSVSAAPAAASATATAAAAAHSAPTTSEQPENFGLSNAQLETSGQKTESLQSIQAHVTELPGDQLRATYVTLDNGQTWKCTDGDMNLRVGEAVTIRRATLGSYLLISESKHSYHVKRLR
jgi:hypothetical protein